MNSRRQYPELIVAISSIAWGLFWIPLRAFERQGLPAGWTGLTQFLVPLIVLAPFAFWRWLRNQPTGIYHIRSGVLVGLALSLYVQSLLLTDVARALILFYVMPAWATLIEVGLMGRPLTRWRIGSLVLSVAGMLTILGIGSHFLSSINLGDVMALLSGLFFAFGAMQIRQTSELTTVFEQLFAFFFYGSIAALLLALLPIAELGAPPTVDQLVALAPAIILISIGFLIPVMWGIYWGSRYVDPGRLGILLQFEAVVGIGSAALLAGEPFGMQQALGAVLVLTAGLIEILGNQVEIE
jgi:drug/metabolite transporter (DMT)-like permease